MVSPALTELHTLCVLSPTCRLLYGQEERNSLTVFEQHMRMYMGTTLANATAIAHRMCSDPAFAVQTALCCAGNAKPCHGARTRDEVTGGCRKLALLQRESVKPAGILLWIAIAVLLLGIIGCLVMLWRKCCEPPKVAPGKGKDLDERDEKGGRVV